MGLISSRSANSWANVEAFASAKESFNAGQTVINSCKVGASGGGTEGFWGDVGGGWYTGGYPEGKAKFAGKNGNDHYAIFKFGGSPSRFLRTEVTAMKFYEGNNSTAGRGLYIRRFALELVSDGGAKEVWDLSGKMGRPGSYGKWHEKSFNSSLISRLKDWHIYKLVVEVSSKGGSGTRDTQTTVEQLQFKTAGNSGWNIVLPLKRDYNKKQYQNMIG